MEQSTLGLEGTFEELDPLEDESDLRETLTSNLRVATTQGTDWTTGTILNQVERQRIQLNPNFQRRDAWTQERKSKFIESLMLGFPIPQIVLAEPLEQRNKFIVIDGKQRLLSLLQFAGSEQASDNFEPLTLQGLEILRDLNGKTREEVEESGYVDLLDDLDNRTIRTIVIRGWEDDSILYHIFLRLNTGSVQLSAQELRNALHPGPFADFVDERSAESPVLRRILNVNRPDFRMRDAELLLRYYAFRNFITAYTGSLKEFMDLTTSTLNQRWDAEETRIRVQADEFEDAVSLAYEVFGSDAFRKWKDGSFGDRFNRAVYDVILFHFWRPELRKEIHENAAAVKGAFIDLARSEPEFVDALESTTKSITATYTRLSLWTHALNAVLSEPAPVPRLVDRRISMP